MGVKFFYICAKSGDRYEFLGDLTLIGADNAIVNNDYDGTGNQYFDSHADALRYIRGRICEDPLYYDPERKAFARITA